MNEEACNELLTARRQRRDESEENSFITKDLGSYEKPRSSLRFHLTTKKKEHKEKQTIANRSYWNRHKTNNRKVI
jgi:hypothetical protein